MNTKTNICNYCEQATAEDLTLTLIPKCGRLLCCPSCCEFAIRDRLGRVIFGNEAWEEKTQGENFLSATVSK